MKRFNMEKTLGVQFSINANEIDPYKLEDRKK